MSKKLKQLKKDREEAKRQKRLGQYLQVISIFLLLSGTLVHLTFNWLEIQAWYSHMNYLLVHNTGVFLEQLIHVAYRQIVTFRFTYPAVAWMMGFCSGFLGWLIPPMITVEDYDLWILEEEGKQ
jgi:hypothetical protein